jgi:signal transduction histidine kinase
MRERVALHDGRLTIESTPSGGTTLAVEVPL